MFKSMGEKRPCPRQLFRGYRYLMASHDPRVSRDRALERACRSRRQEPADLARARARRYIWSRAGPIPAGHEVHHVDGDPLNNRPSNLRLLSRADHTAIHRGDRSRRSGAPPPIRVLRNALRGLKRWRRAVEERSGTSSHSPHADISSPL